MLRWRLILKQYGPELKYIHEIKNIASSVVSRLQLGVKQNSTHKYSNTTENIFIINGVEKIPDSILH